MADGDRFRTIQNSFRCVSCHFHFDDQQRIPKYLNCTHGLCSLCFKVIPLFVTLVCVCVFHGVYLINVHRFYIMTEASNAQHAISQLHIVLLTRLN